MGKIPNYNTISDWVKKCGLKAYEESGELLKGTDYAEITDESMMIGEEKLLFTVRVPAKHQGCPLKFSDTNVLDIAVAKSWNGETVTRQLKKTQEKVGHQPDYIISDIASILKKGVREANMSHQIADSYKTVLPITYWKSYDLLHS